MTKHAEDRLQTRIQPQHRQIAAKLCSAAYECYSTALVTQVSRNLSLVVIARSFAPVTVFYRETIRVTPLKLGVDTVREVS